MAAVTICSDFGAQKNKVWHCFHCFPIYFPWSDGMPPTAAPLNRQLQSRDLGEPDPDSPAVKVTRGASHGSDSYWLHQSQRNANHTCQRVLPVCSRDSLTHWDIPLPAQCQKRWRLALQSAKQTLLQTSAKRGLQKAVRFPVITTLSVLAAP